jgi:hypothetical protein
MMDRQKDKRVNKYGINMHEKTGKNSHQGQTCR